MSEEVQVTLLFSRLVELADAEGAIPDDGSGVDGVWTTTVTARDRDRDWRIAINAEPDEERTATDFPAEGRDTDVPAGHASLFLGETPVGAAGPFGGTVAAEIEDGTPTTIEDELVDDIEARLAELQEADP